MVSNKNTGGISIYIHRYNRTITTIWIFPSQEIYLLVLKKHSDIENLKINKTVNFLVI
jgi:hypothetical protein